MAKRRVGKKGSKKRAALKIHGGFKSMEHKAMRKRAPRKRG